MNESEAKFEVVFISSDTDAAAQQNYMHEMHGDWLAIAHDDPLRELLKQKYGCFAGNEQSKWPAVTRRSGIPSLVVIGSDGSEVEFNALNLVETKGPPILKKWPVW